MYAVALSLRACLGWLALFAALVPGAASAQHITIDGTLSRARTLVGPRYSIGANLGRQVGGNLFESFGIFGLSAGESATFSGPATVGNIIGRVTGGDPSSIDGAIRSTIAGANVYLINPYGVVFGPQGTVNVSGSFYASTANYLKMANGARFQATHPKASTLSAAPPAAFGFLDAKPAKITVNGSTLEARGTIGLVGGPVSTRQGATIKAPAGTIDVASVAGRGEVPVAPRNTAALTVKEFGRVKIAGGSNLVVGNPNGRGRAGSVFVRSSALAISASTIDADNYGARPGGEIVLQADGSLSIENGGQISASTNGAGAAGRIVVAVTGRLVINASGGVYSQADTGSTGAGGDVSVSADSLSLRNGGIVSASTFGPGAAGSVAVAVAGQLTINGAGATALTGIAAQANPGSTGRAGEVTVAAGGLIVKEGGEISVATFGTNNAGTVAVTAGALSVASGAAISADSDPGSNGNAGIVIVKAGSLDIAGGQISSGLLAAFNGAPASRGRHGGKVTVDVSGLLTILNSGGIFAQANQGSTGAGGDVSVAAGSLAIDNGGVVSAMTFGSGDAGSVAVAVAGRLTINGAGATALTGIAAQANPGSTGAGGDVSVTAGALSIANYGEIAGSTFGSGAGSDISVSAGSLSIRNGGIVSASTFGSGDAGSVAVAVAGRLTINGAGATALTGIAAQANPGKYRTSR